MTTIILQCGFMALAVIISVAVIGKLSALYLAIKKDYEEGMGHADNS